MYRSEPSRCWESLLIVFLIVFLTIQLQGCLHLTQVLNDPSFDGLGEAQRLIQIKPVPATDPPAPSPTRRNNITYDFSADRPGCGTATVSTDIFVPIFVMTRDRVSSLRETLESYKRTIASPYSIIILDHNSTYPPMLDYLAYLQSENNVTVHTLRNETWNMACVESADYIGDYLRAHPDVQYYVFTDPGASHQLHYLPSIPSLDARHHSHHHHHHHHLVQLQTLPWYGRRPTFCFFTPPSWRRVPTCGSSGPSCKSPICPHIIRAKSGDNHCGTCNANFGKTLCRTRPRGGAWGITWWKTALTAPLRCGAGRSASFDNAVRAFVPTHPTRPCTWIGITTHQTCPPTRNIICNMPRPR